MSRKKVEKIPNPLLTKPVFCGIIIERLAKAGPEYGGVAQLGERTVRIRKVESSILFVSTRKRQIPTGICRFQLNLPIRVGEIASR